MEPPERAAGVRAAENYPSVKWRLIWTGNYYPEREASHRILENTSPTDNIITVGLAKCYLFVLQLGMHSEICIQIFFHLPTHVSTRMSIGEMLL